MSKTAEPAALLSPREAAEYIGIKRNTLAIWRSTNRQTIPFLRIGTRLVKYRREDLDRYLESRVTGTASE